MAPALTETATDGHGVHLSSPLPSSALDADATMLGKELNSQMKLMGDSAAEPVWLNRTFLHSAKVCGEGAMELEDIPFTSPLAQSPGHYKTVLFSSSSSVLNLLSLNKKQSGDTNSAVLKGSLKNLFDHPSIFLVSIPEHKSRGIPKASERKIPHLVHEPMPDIGCAVNSSQIKSRRQNESECKSSAKGSFTFLTPAKINGSLGRAPAWHGSIVRKDMNAQPWDFRGAGDLSLIHCTAGEEAGVNSQLFQCLARHQTLVSQASQIQKRLQTLLGEHAATHCSEQLQGLRAHHFRTHTASSSAATEHTCSLLEENSFDLSEAETRLWNGLSCSHPNQTTSMPSNCSSEIQKFTHYAKAVLSGISEVLDSEATDSSSDEEWDHEIGTKNVPVSPSCEQRWLIDRSEISSRWTWLQARISELEYKIQQLGDLHRQILSSKGKVILADSQPLTDRLIQQMLLTETADLLSTARDNKAPAEVKDLSSELDFEMEPSSPTHLLRNIERQSAQLTEIVNSLMPPLNFSPTSSPVSKASRWKGQTKWGSHSETGNGELFLQNSTCVAPEHTAKKRRVCKRKQKLPHMSNTWVSARTRPLQTYHRRRLFVLDTPWHSSQEGQMPTTAACQCYSSCDHPAVCSKSACVRESVITRMTKTEQMGLLESSFHPVLSLSSDIPIPLHFQAVLHHEDWVNRPVAVNPVEKEDISSPDFTSCENTYPDFFPLLDCDHIENHHSELQKEEYWDLSPAHTTRAGQEMSKHTGRGGKKRRHTSQTGEDEKLFLSQLLDTSCYFTPTPEESPSDLATSSQGHRHSGQNSARRRLRTECFYDIDNIVIPMSLAATTKVEKLQYKDILTPSWRVVDTQCWEKKQGEMEEIEEIYDEAISSRHMKYEEKEKARWSSWEHNRWQRRNTRLSSRNADLSLSGDQALWAGRAQSEMSKQAGRACYSTAAATAGIEDSQQEHTLILPWERRVFPLQEHDAEALKPERDVDPLENLLHCQRPESCNSDSKASGSTPASGGIGTITPSAGHPGNSPKEEQSACSLNS
ncbi:KAT8 regulatory NSL complex subunit 1-like protein [Lepisosteus oculatus]|uniref:KAT8 regulatory NSL complex subunit 1-like protein n=1 Tax=Lepisosteus oculatus TaxID=7918 RepID=UPI0035F50E6E